MAARIQLRRATTAAWAAANPILAQGEVGVVIDGGGGFKIGDGVTLWNVLPFQSKTSPTGAIVGTTDAQALTNKDLTGAGNTFPTWNQNTTGNAATATKLATARNINGVPFDGTGAITVADATAEKTANKNAANGYAGLDSGGKVAAAQLPSYVDDALEYANLAAFPGTGSSGIIYVADDTGKIYRWSGSAYVEISPSPGSTDAVTEGTTNLYYTNARADARVAAGNAATATKLATARNINGVPFDGTGAITVADATKQPALSEVAKQTSNYTAAANQFVPVDASSGAVTVTFPTAPADGTRVVVKKVDSSTNTVSLALAGSDVFNVAAGPTTGSLVLQNQAVQAQYDSAHAIWYVISTDVPLGGLDGRFEPLEQFAILQSAYTLTSQTALQQLLNTTTNGAVTLPVGDYFFECGFSLSSMSASSGSFGFGFGGTATFTQSWGALAEKASNITFGSAGMSWSTANAANLIAVNTNTNAAALIRGRLTVTVAGTVIPQVSLGVAAAAIVGVGSYFRIQSVNSTAAFAGAWS